MQFGSSSVNAPVDQPANWYRGFIQGKTRITLAWIFVGILGFFSREYPTPPGIALCFFGALLRFWAGGYLRKDLRPAVGGPYAFVRNPLYLGTYLMAVGTVLSIENWPLLFAVSILFAAIYHYIILDEETKLGRLFQENYADYCRLVPRFFPRLWPPFAPASEKELTKVNAVRAHHVFSMPLALQNKSYEAFASFAGLILFVLGAAYIWKHI